MTHSTIILATLLQYARHPATPNAPGWVSFMVPEDFISVVEEALAEDLANNDGQVDHWSTGLPVGDVLGVFGPGSGS